MKKICFINFEDNGSVINALNLDQDAYDSIAIITDNPEDLKSIANINEFDAIIDFDETNFDESFEKLCDDTCCELFMEIAKEISDCNKSWCSAETYCFNAMKENDIELAEKINIKLNEVL